ncbi:MAG: glycosyl transferase family 1 [Bacteroidia bacterium]|nr:glycosyl transferase family 1 [Bacteroidia bacterium]
MKKVLIITYYWPPSGGAGVQRWLKFVKYLRNFGWEPVVYTPSNPENPVDDASLLKDLPSNLEVLQQPIWEPYDLYKKFIGQKPHQKINAGFISENKKPKLTEKISVFIRGNFFIPDARVFWVKPSVKFLTSYLKENKVDALISTGPPHSMHLIAMQIHKKNNLPWLADFRDPWTNIDFYKDLLLTKTADKKHHKLEKEVLQKASRVITIGSTMAKEFQIIANRNVDVITNGFDDADKSSEVVIEDKKFSIAHIGSLNKDRNPQLLWEVLSEMIAGNPVFKADLEIKLAGKIDFTVIDKIDALGLADNLRKIEYLKHNEVIIEQQRSQILLLLVNNTPNAKGILTGKLFEYLAAKRPILCIGVADGDAAKIINETQSGVVVNFGDKEKMKATVSAFYEQFKNNKLKVTSQSVDRYSRKNLTQQLVEVLNQMTS